MKRKILICLAVFFTAVSFVKTSVSALGMDDITIHGFVSQGYLKSSDNNVFADTEDGTHDFFESAISFSVEPIENLRMGLQLMSRDLGDSGNGTLFLDLGYADYRWKDALGFRVGLVEVPIGLYNKDRDLDFLRTSIFLPQSIYNENYRTFRSAFRGAGIYGNFDIGGAGDIEYEILSGTPELDEDEPFFKNMYYSLIGNNSEDVYTIDMDFAYAAAVRWNTWLDGLRVGVTQLNTDIDTELGYSGTYMTYDISGYLEIDVDYDFFWVASVEYTHDPFKIVGEYCRKRQVTEGSIYSSGLPPVIPAGTMPIYYETTAEMYYGMISYRINDLLELGTYYSVHYPDVDNKGGAANKQKDLAVSARFDVLPAMTIKLETHFIDGTADMFYYLNPDGVEDDCILYAAKCSVNF